MKEFYDLLSTIQHFAPVRESRTIEISTDEDGYKTIGKLVKSATDVLITSMNVRTEHLYDKPEGKVVVTIYHLSIDFMVPQVSDTVRSTSDPVLGKSRP